MTTICWNKNELVADSRVTYFDESGKKLSHADHEVCKIYAPTTFTVGADVVKAIAISGTDRLITILSKLNDESVVPNTDIAVVKDLKDQAFYDQFGALIMMESYLIVVACENNYLVKMTPREEGGITWIVYTVSKDEHILAGSGAVEILKAINDENKLGSRVTMEDVKSKPARQIVQLGIVCDPFSGGKLRVWTEAEGHQVVDLDPVVFVSKQYADEQPDGYLPVTGNHDEELDRRLAAHLAEKQAA